MNKYSLTTLSRVIISPRGSTAFYKDIDFKKEDIGNKNNNIIYPFYRYGEYDEYTPQKARYYIPASSIKGALLSNESKTLEKSQIFLEDIPVTYHNIELGTLIHASHIEFLFPKDATNNANQNDVNSNAQNDKVDEGKQPCFEEFFGKVVGLEMLQKGITLTGQYTSSALPLSIDNMHRFTMKKLVNYITQIDAIYRKAQELSYSDKGKNIFLETLGFLRNNVEDIYKGGKRYSTGEGLMFLGGYKGLLRSLNTSKSEELEDRSAIFVDSQGEDALPFGIVKITAV